MILIRIDLNNAQQLVLSVAPSLQAACLDTPHLPLELIASLDRCHLILPKGRSLGRRWLRMAWEVLRPGGQLFVAGSKKGGVQSIFSDAAELFGAQSLLGYKKGFHLARFLRPTRISNPPEWFSAPGIAPATWQPLPLDYPGLPAKLVTLPGVFSSSRLDEGTCHLLDALTITPGEHVLDLGCGCGVIGLLAARQGADRVDLVDINLYAVAASRENMQRFLIHQARVAPGNASTPFADERYTLVVTNPPFHDGHQVETAAAQDFISAAAQVLLPGGRFILVANRFLPYEKVITQYFKHYEELYANGRYKVIGAQK